MAKHAEIKLKILPTAMWIAGEAPYPFNFSCNPLLVLINVFSGWGEECRVGKIMFIKDRLVNKVAKDLLPLFEIGDFHSDTPIRDIIPAALDALKDRGLPARMNLAGLVSKKARLLSEKATSGCSEQRTFSKSAIDRLRIDSIFP